MSPPEQQPKEEKSEEPNARRALFKKAFKGAADAITESDASVHMTQVLCRLM